MLLNLTNNLTRNNSAQDLILGDRERWYVVHTLPRRELGAQTQLQMQGFRTFFPHIIKTIRHARKFRTIKAAAFPRYLFVILDPDRDRWRSVNGTFGVSHILAANGRPEPVPNGIVETLLAATDDLRVLRVDCALQLDQRVRVLAGPFADAIGRLDRLDEKGRVRVLLEIMGGQVPTILDRRHLAAAAPGRLRGAGEARVSLPGRS